MGQPTILLTNDDGIDSKGLVAFEEAMSSLGDVWVVAPERNQSSISSAISLREPLRVDERSPQRFAVSGTPADCVYLATNELVDGDIDLCVSGINHGANLADDVLYSGTVAGAIEATLVDIPAIAVSLASRKLEMKPDEAEAVHEALDAGAAFARKLARQVIERRLPRSVLLNVNVPEDADDQTPAVVGKMGRRDYLKEVHQKLDPRGKPYFWLGGAELAFDDLPGSDCNAIARSKISVTPIRLDMTDHRFADELEDWGQVF